jgi:hypothetical protein
MAVKYKLYQHFPLQEPPKFTQIGILGLKINHLATQPAPGVKFTDRGEVDRGEDSLFALLFF